MSIPILLQQRTMDCLRYHFTGCPLLKDHRATNIWENSRWCANQHAQRLGRLWSMKTEFQGCTSLSAYWATGPTRIASKTLHTPETYVRHDVPAIERASKRRPLCSGSTRGCRRVLLVAERTVQLQSMGQRKQTLVNRPCFTYNGWLVVSRPL